MCPLSLSVAKNAWSCTSSLSYAFVPYTGACLPFFVIFLSALLSISFPFFLSASPTDLHAVPIISANVLFLISHSVKCYSGQSTAFRLPPAKYSCTRYFRNVDTLFLVHVCGCSPEHLAPSLGLPDFGLGEEYSRVMEIYLAILCSVTLTYVRNLPVLDNQCWK